MVHLSEHVDPVAISPGPLKIHWYGIAYLVAFICVYLWMSRPAGLRRLGLTRDQIQDFLFYALVGVLVGGRTFFVFNDIISKHDASRLHCRIPINIIAVWNGGMAFHGGLVGVMVAVWLFVRKHPQLEIYGAGRRDRDDAADRHHAGASRQLHQRRTLGRRLPPGPPVVHDLPSAPPGRHPLPPSRRSCTKRSSTSSTLPVLLILYRMKPKDGVVAWTWFTCYGITRSIAEIWRQADFTLASGITGGQLYALPMIVIGMIGIVYCATRPGPRTEVARDLRALSTAGDVEERYRALRADSSTRSCAPAGAPAGSVTLVGVSKKTAAETSPRAIRAGLADIGENYLQEAKQKFALSPAVRKHFIGHLQTNKAKAIVEIFDVVQSVDRIEAGQALSRAAAALGKVLAVLLQLNVSPAERFGCPPDEAERLAGALRAAPGLRLDGVMAIGPRTEDREAISQRFRAGRQDVCPRRWKYALDRHVGRLARGGARGLDDDPPRDGPVVRPPEREEKTYS